MLIKVLLMAGMICLAVFVILCMKHVDFCIIWLLGFLVCAGWGGYLLYRMKNPAGFRLPGFIISFFLLGMGLFLISFITVEGMILYKMTEKSTLQPEYMIVLGAQVKKNKASKALTLRLEKAVKYLNQTPGVIAVLSGGQGDGEEISEAACMYQYLLDAGIEDDRVLLEDLSTTTKENLMYSASVIARHLKSNGKGEIDPKSCVIGILSNNFHIFRAVAMAQRQGYVNVYGIAARSDWRLQIHYLIREYFAVIQAKIKGDI